MNSNNVVSSLKVEMTSNEITVILLEIIFSNKQNKEFIGLLRECNVIATKNITKVGYAIMVCDVS